MNPKNPLKFVDKEALRARVWREMEERGVGAFPKPIWGRIPNFVGREKAAEKLRRLREYRSASTLMVNPDSPQAPIREIALRDGKRLLVATPRLRNGFVLLDPERIDPVETRGVRNLLKRGYSPDLRNLEVDLVVEGSVAVDLEGGRLGKGSGFGDLEIAILAEFGAVDESTPLITSVHELQIVDEVPMTDHDVPVDFILTPERIIETKRRHPKPLGIRWEILPAEVIRGIPILGELREKHDSGC